MKRSTSILVICACVWQALAYPGFKDVLPNGNEVPHPCKANYLWHGVGHHNPLGGGTRNQFGLDFSAAGRSWTVELCGKDSDGDGLTNGQELGDPECVWTPGNLPSRITGITHPGICTLEDGSICDQEKAWVDCEVADGLKDCPVLKEPETLNMTVRFPETPVPAVETSYMCMIFDLPSDRDYHLMAYEPVIDNEHVMHHILLYGCDPNDPVEASELNKVGPCGMGAGSKCGTIIGLWAVGFTGYCINGPMGFRFGGDNVYKQAAMEFHWNNPQFVNNYKDSSGMTLYYTPKLRPNDAALLTTGQADIEIPPGVNSYTVVGTCPSECSRMLMKGPINIFWATNHMHYLGHEMKIEINRGGEFYTQLTYDEIYNYDNPTETKYSTAVQVLPGDEIVTTCKYKSLSRPKTTFFGDATSDEMCFGFAAYYPAGNMYSPSCTAWRNISTCEYWQGNHKGCDFHAFVNGSNANTAATRKLVKDNCKPFGNCLKECKPVLEKLMAEHPCLSGDVYKLVREITAGSKDDVEMIEFLAAIDSCRVEMAPVVNVNNDDTNRSNHLGAFYSLLAPIIMMTIFFIAI